MVACRKMAATQTLERHLTQAPTRMRAPPTMAAQEVVVAALEWLPLRLVKMLLRPTAVMDNVK